jgi:hypothetical protein
MVVPLALTKGAQGFRHAFLQNVSNQWWRTVQVRVEPGRSRKTAIDGNYTGKLAHAAI